MKRVYNAGDPRLGEGATPFMRAARGGDALVMRLLLAAGADPMLAQKNGNTPIHLAASISLAGNNSDRGTDAERARRRSRCVWTRASTSTPSTPRAIRAVHTALGSPAIVRYLAEHGAKLDVKNKQGRTPLDTVLRNRESNEETVALLRRLTGA